MKLYVVVYTGYDKYDGVFGTEVLGVFDNEEDAQECKKIGPAMHYYTDMEITIQEVKFTPAIYKSC